ncbi:MAG: hypothetical protein MUC48_25675 [Leptolyngbya sp. Prado105]|jgi:hypothetical protein|nr:hypothetical protein [Leptolyngbya sp. Prado105]
MRVTKLLRRGDTLFMKKPGVLFLEEFLPKSVPRPVADSLSIHNDSLGTSIQRFINLAAQPWKFS